MPSLVGRPRQERVKGRHDTAFAWSDMDRSRGRDNANVDKVGNKDVRAISVPVTDGPVSEVEVADHKSALKAAAVARGMDQVAVHVISRDQDDMVPALHRLESLLGLDAVDRPVVDGECNGCIESQNG